MKKDKPKKLVDLLYKKVQRDSKRNRSHYPDFRNNYFHQADLLFLPDDDGFKYALVVVDVGSRLVDAEPLKTKTPKEIIKAFKKIYKRDILEPPTNIMSVDAGSEFKGDVKKYFEIDLGVNVKVAKPGRHRQQAIVEIKNKDIGKHLFKRMTAEELQTGEVSKAWIDYLPTVITLINKITKKTRKRTIDKKLKYDQPCEGDACNLLEEGTKVRVMLDMPRNVYDDKRLPGPFRETDIRWNPKPRTVMKVSIAPNTVPMYLIDDGEGNIDYSTAYTKSQLQVISNKEIKPTEDDIMPHKEKGIDKWIVEKIIGKTKIKNKIYFKVKWKHFSKSTYEPRTNLLKDVPDLVKEFERNNK